MVSDIGVYAANSQIMQGSMLDQYFDKTFKISQIHYSASPGVYHYTIINDGTLDRASDVDDCYTSNGVPPHYKFSEVILDLAESLPKEDYTFKPFALPYPKASTGFAEARDRILNNYRTVLINDIRYLLDVKDDSEILSKIIELKRNQKS